MKTFCALRLIHINEPLKSNTLTFCRRGRLHEQYYYLNSQYFLAENVIILNIADILCKKRKRSDPENNLSIKSRGLKFGCFFVFLCQWNNKNQQSEKQILLFHNLTLCLLFVYFKKSKTFIVQKLKSPYCSCCNISVAALFRGVSIKARRQNIHSIITSLIQVSSTSVLETFYITW